MHTTAYIISIVPLLPLLLAVARIPSPTTIITIVVMWDLNALTTVSYGGTVMTFLINP